jgi:death-on-curing protein
LGRPAQEIAREAALGRAESALSAPFASYEGLELYPLLHEKAAVLGHRLVCHRPLRDGNKRVALVCLIVFVERNGARWIPPPGGQDEIAATIERLTMGQLSERELASWLRARIGGDR